MNTVGERIAEDWACGRLFGTIAEAIDAACAKAKAFAVKGDGWKPIETAPDDEFVLVYDDYSKMRVHAVRRRSVDAEGNDTGMAWFTGYTWGTALPVQNPTHWQKLPLAPTSEIEGDHP